MLSVKNLSQRAEERRMAAGSPCQATVPGQHATETSFHSETYVPS
jgi:hypothetical protein